VRSATLGLNERPSLFGKATALRGVNRACKLCNAVKFILHGRKIGQHQGRSPKCGGLSRKFRVRCGDGFVLKSQRAGSDCDHQNQRGPCATILLASSCRAFARIYRFDGACRAAINRTAGPLTEVPDLATIVPMVLFFASRLFLRASFFPGFGLQRDIF